MGDHRLDGLLTDTVSQGFWKTPGPSSLTVNVTHLSPMLVWSGLITVGYALAVVQITINPKKLKVVFKETLMYYL